MKQIRKLVTAVILVTMIFSMAMTAFAASGKWKQNSKGWWYSYTDGGYAADQWEQIGGKWYHFDSQGYMQTGWQKISGKWYYLGTNGVMTTGWQKVSGKWYYLGADGAMATGWQKSGGKWYYLGTDGAMTTGWQKVSGKWYYLDSSGVMQTGWQKVSGKWYHLDSSGVMQTGWQKIGGKWYYFRSSGVMVTGTQIIGGKTYIFNSNGVWQGSSGAATAWNNAYRNFVMNRQYASDSLINTGSSGLSGGVRFALRDINGDGTAELLIDSNARFFAGWLTVVYTYSGGNVIKAGTAGVLGLAGTASADSSRPGIFGYNARTGGGQCVYFTLKGTSVVEETVFTDNLGSSEPYQYTIKASDKGLYTAYKNGTTIYYYSESEINTMGWNAFVQACGF